MIKAQTLTPSRPVYLELKESLVEQIRSGRLVAGTPLPSERAISSTYGVSRDTVKRTLKELEEEEYIYRKRGNRPTVSDNIELTPPALKPVALLSHVPFSAALDQNYNQLHNVLLHIMRRLEQENLDLTILTCPNDASLSLPKLRGLQRSSHEALIYFPGGGYIFPELEQELVNVDVPLILVEAYSRNHDIKADTIDLDNEYGAYLATEYLIKQGHRKILHLTFDSDPLWIEERIIGFQRACRDYGLSAQDAKVVAAADFKQKPQQLDYTNLEQNLDGTTGIFASTDNLAALLIPFLKERNLTIPGDVSIVGFDNIPPDLGIGLTTVSHMTAEIGAKTTDIVLRRLRGEDTAYLFKERVKPNLIIRDSVRPLERY